MHHYLQPISQEQPLRPGLDGFLSCTGIPLGRLHAGARSATGTLDRCHPCVCMDHGADLSGQARVARTGRSHELTTGLAAGVVGNTHRCDSDDDAAHHSFGCAQGMGPDLLAP